MKKTKKQANRIIENIYDIVMKTDFEPMARKQMARDLKNKNISLDYENGTIEIQNEDGTQTQYTITIA